MIEVTYIDHMGSDLSVVNAARVSFGKKSDWIPRVHNGEAKQLSQKDTKLINYLAKHKHTSPFGHAFASFHVKAPLFVHAQLVKHKFLRVNTVSRRYIDSEPEFYVPDAWRERSIDKKQGSGDIMLNVDHLIPEWDEIYGGIVYTDSNIVCLNAYEGLLSQGVAPEMARMVLPQSMMTEWYWSGSLDAFADMCNLRCKLDTQYESRIVANKVFSEMLKLYPVSWAALMENNDD